MIYQILVFFVVISLAAGSEINLRKLYEDAEEKMDSELRSQMMAGMKSSRMNRKKFTAYSREMAKRNTLFKKMVESLIDDHGMADDESSKLSKQALIENRQNRKNTNNKGSGAGGQ